MKLLVVGAGGQVGAALASSTPGAGEQFVALTRAQLDLQDVSAVRETIAAIAPDVVINASAYTDVERAETEEGLALSVNCDAPAHLSAVTAAIGAAFIHMSTDFVFDGRKGAPYVEDDAPAPLGAYARTKLAGEASVQPHPRLAIVRTAWVYSATGRNFVKTMLRVAGQRPEVSVVADQRGNPTSATDIAAGLLAVARRMHADADNLDLYGLLHMAAPDDASWADVAEAAFVASRALGGPAVPVRRITSAEYPSKVQRPADSRLDSGRLRRVYGLVLPSWRDSLQTCVASMLAKGIEAP